jgi:hypothetical protein
MLPSGYSILFNHTSCRAPFYTISFCKQHLPYIAWQLAPGFFVTEVYMGVDLMVLAAFVSVQAHRWKYIGDRVL